LLNWIIKISAIFYQSPPNLNYWWNFGSLSFYFLIIQIVTGIFLAMFYNPSAYLAYYIIMELNNEIYYGWLLRSLHANGASFFFLCVYLHMLRGIYYGSFAYPRQSLWISGMIIFILMIVTAFLGYILPWGQMSFWAAMVITSLLAVIPLIGADLIFLLWGGFSIHDATLHRFYSLHFAFPFLILILTIVHLFLLHEFGSNNPLGITAFLDWIPFSPYYILKDCLMIFVFLILICYIIFVVPDLLGHSINFEKANFLVTPVHIVPEWYFLFFYAVLRSVTNKLLGFFFMILSIFVLIVLPYILKNLIIRNGGFRPLHAVSFWLFVVICIQLSWFGGVAVLSPNLELSQLYVIFYFWLIVFFFPFSNFIDKTINDALTLQTLLNLRVFLKRQKLILSFRV
jgi:ubiquinol-cytochrome c reductase cytochrome b subunit